ncbi:3629_t:CDS:1, partial [Racocetra fulgida]
NLWDKLDDTIINEQIINLNLEIDIDDIKNNELDLDCIDLDDDDIDDTDLNYTENN